MSVDWGGFVFLWGESRGVCDGGDATYLEGRTRIRSGRLRCCTNWTGIRTAAILVGCWTRCRQCWVAEGSCSRGSQEQVVEPGVAGEQCWMDGVAGGAQSVEPVGGGDAVRKDRHKY